ncbi:M14 family zinc carboxypeptidase [Nonomuraea sp. NPDC050556]|uniref:M14 family metallopeptidase n=1 Tax=Nonomuraea sp. NPDC050556 TaxID=3364369 RepID=UPI00378D410E
MKRLSIIAALCLLSGLLTAVPAQAEPAIGPKIYAADLTLEQLDALRQEAVDREDFRASPASGGKIRVEIVLNPVIAEKLRGQGMDFQEQAAPTARARSLAAGVFRPYSGAGNIREELLQAAKDHPLIAKAVDIGTTVQGKPITAVRVTLGARVLPDRVKPAVVYQAAQHAREWITPEMVRRLMHHYLDNYGKDREITKLVNTVDLWFVPVVNVDGYDHTFTEGNRLWRKNLHDNDGDGVVETGEGVDLNRNFPHKWGYDNEGSSPVPASETFRGTAAASEPETQAQIAFMNRVRPKFVVNWHSAAELLLHGVGWQVYTPTPDDLIHNAILGDTATPAVPNYVPEIGAQLYTTNGETDGYYENTYGALTHTPEMSTCQRAAAVDPNDEWTDEDCDPTGFEFPDDEKLISGEVAKNLPYALGLAKSAYTPDRPVSVVGRTVPDLQADPFTVSYGTSQDVAATMRRSLPVKLLHYRINGGREQVAPVTEWKGGERYGGENDTYFAEYRGRVTGQKPGDKVEAWFTALTSKSEKFTYTVRDQAGAEVLVVADEDYKGVNPTYPSTVTAPKYAQQYVDALKAAGRKALVWDIDADGVPHHLGALGHFKGVVWYLGDNRLTQDAADETITVFGNPRKDAQVADRAFALTLSMRDYLNEGGKLVYSGETAAYFGSVLSSGIFYGLKGYPDKPCVVTTSTRDDCETLANDFVQYWLGVSGRTALNSPTGVDGSGPLDGVGAAFATGGANPLNEAGNFTVTSALLNERDFPLFKSSPIALYRGRTGPFEPVEGKWYAAARHVNYGYSRLVRTIDLTSVTAAQAPKLEAQLSYNTEARFDFVLAEAHTVGVDDWVTLPDLNGATVTAVPDECEQGYLLAAHPWLKHYLTPGNPCTATNWNAFTGNSGGWKKTAFDLSAYAGKKVEVSFSYVADPGTGFQGAFVDDTKVTTTSGTVDAEGFETGLSPWTVPGPPAGSVNVGADFARANSLGAPAVATADSVTLGFGLEQVSTTAERDALMKRVTDYLLSPSATP